MTRIVYADPNISPNIWRPRPGDIVLPLHEHPSIMEDMTPVEPRELPPPENGVRRKPAGSGRPPSVLVEQLYDYLSAHGPTTLQGMSEALGIPVNQVKNTIDYHRSRFRRVGRLRSEKPGPGRVLWGVVES